MLKLGGNVGVRARAQGGNNILCVCGTNVDLYIQLSCASKRRRDIAGTRAPGWGSGLRGASDFYPRNYGVEIGRKFTPTFSLKFSPTFGLNPPPLGLLLRV